MISVIILTHNEEADLPACLQALAWCDDLHVVDSGSTDRTREIAASFGACVEQHPFESFGKQRNWALDHCKIKHPWILFLDADEVCTPEFLQAIKSAVQSAPELIAGYYCCWKFIYQGVWLKRCDSFPRWQFRLVKVGKARFTDAGHGQKESEVQGTIEYIREPYLHYAMSKGVRHWITRHNKYSDQEAIYRTNANPRWKDLFSSHTSIRNQALKPILTKIPGWPVLRFVWAYFVKGGFLEGRPGLIYCVNIAYYEFLIKVKISEGVFQNGSGKKTL
ncbi:MAG: glycosyltransferase family 2 protein [Verrucomicrobiota bacterium]|nr:glycosyltransferase family 2 protein [Verrucomicrobiota bacterium]